MARVEASISIASQSPESVTFTATITKGKPGTVSLWVFFKTYDANGNLVGAANLPVIGEETGSGLAGPFAKAGVSHSAYVWAFGDPQKPVSDTLEF